jgi:ABC-type multidrug transport system fused ATPase/permease subunit
VSPIAAKRRLPLLSALIGASLCQAALAAVAAFCVQKVFDTLLAPSAAASTISPALIALIFVGGALCAAGLEIYRTWAGEKLGLGYVAEVRTQLFARIMHASAATLSQKQQGGLLLPFVGDLTAIKKWVSDGLVRLISASVMLTFLLAIMALQSPLLAAIAGAIVLVAGIAIIWLSGPLSRAIRASRAKRGAVANFVASSLRTAQTVQAFDRFAREATRLEKRSTALLVAGLRLARVSGSMSAIVSLAAAALVAGTLVIGVIESQRGAMSIGTIAAAISLAGLLAGAVRDLGVGFDLGRRAQASFAKVERALAIEAAVPSGGATRKLRGEHRGVALKSVSANGLFRKVSAAAGPGEIVNLIGESGSGKSTLLAIIARLRDPDSGRVRLGGRDLRRVSLGSLRRRVGLASASAPLMRGSIAMNLRYREANAADAEIARVVEICNLAPVLQRLEMGEQTRLGDGAPELALGEVQRILIARAMVGNPAVLILDGVDTHLDDETAARIAAALKNYPGTVLMAATAPALRRVANVNWRMSGGRVDVQPVIEREAAVIDLVPKTDPTGKRVLS